MARLMYAGLPPNVRSPVYQPGRNENVVVTTDAHGNETTKNVVHYEKPSFWKTFTTVCKVIGIVASVVSIGVAIYHFIAGAFPAAIAAAGNYIQTNHPVLYKVGTKVAEGIGSIPGMKTVGTAANRVGARAAEAAEKTIEVYNTMRTASKFTAGTVKEASKFALKYGPIISPTDTLSYVVDVLQTFRQDTTATAVTTAIPKLAGLGTGVFAPSNIGGGPTGAMYSILKYSVTNP